MQISYFSHNQLIQLTDHPTWPVCPSLTKRLKHFIGLHNLIGTPDFSTPDALKPNTWAATPPKMRAKTIQSP